MDKTASEKQYLRLLDKLESLREMLRTTWALEGLALSAAVFLGALLVGFALDNLFWLSAPVRLIFLLSTLTAAVGLLIWRTVRPLTHSLPDERAAVILEKKYPGLDNAVINAVQLGKESLEGYSRLVADEVVRQAETQAKTLELPRAVEKRTLKRHSVAAAAAVVVAVLYVALFPAYFANAFARYSHFATYVAPLTRTKIAKVEPGNTTLRSGDDLVITCTLSGERSDGAQVRFGAGLPLSMQFDGGVFLYRLPDVTEPLTYIVCAGDARSPEFRVKVIYVPTIERMDVTYRYPGYTGLPPKLVENVGGDLEAIIGTTALVRAECSKPVSYVSVDMKGVIARTMAKGTSVSWELPIKRSGTYEVKLMDRSGHDNSFTYQVSAFKDSPPRVIITRPARDVTFATDSGRAELPINFRATDDVGVRKCVLMVGYAGAEPVAIRNWRLEGGVRDVTDGHLLTIDTDAKLPGYTVTYCVRAEDGRPENEGKAASKTYRVTIIKPRDKRIESIKSLVDIHSKLRKLLKAQTRNLKRTVSLGRQLAQAGRTDQSSHQALNGIHSNQLRVHRSADEIAAAVACANEFERKVKETLLGLSANEMLEAVREIEKARRSDLTKERVETLKAAATWEEKIVAALSRLLQDIPAEITQLKKGEEGTQELAQEDLNLKKEVARNFVDGLEEFLKEQKKIIEATQELEKKAVEDWTEGDEKILAELEKLEQDWSRWFKDMQDDLSRLPEQDFSDSKLCEEIMEIYEEVELAKDALTRREIELAVPHEQAGLEKAEELTTNLERWLPDVRDYIKWVMEDIPEDQEIPLTDLPEELEDIIGDLIEQEEQLSEDADDLSSAWADSLDKGAGWGASDGPISNMSAKGVTGNTLPNTNEIGGRSGEGRSGKSSGQMVEKTATGKGGRKTPTRLTPDPFEAGAVEDTSKDPTGGATGGGKLSGGGEEGLRGPAAPQIKEQMQRLARQQAQIMSKSERLTHNLKKARLPAGDLEAAVGAMRRAEACLKNVDLNSFTQQKRIVVENLEDAKRVVAAQVRAKRELLLSIPKDVRDELISAQKERFPEKYKELLSNYYRALSSPRNHRENRELDDE